MLRRPRRPAVEESDEEQNKKLMKKTKRIVDDEKVEQSIKNRDFSGFIQTITESMKQLQKTDPSFKKLMKNMFDDEADSVGAASSKTEGHKKPLRSRQDSMEKIPDRVEEEADSEDKLSRAHEDKEEILNTTKKLKEKYEHIVGYATRYNQVKDLSLVAADSLYLVRADSFSLAQIWDRITVLVVDADLKSNLSVVYCILHDVPIVNYDWVATSVKCQKVLDPRKFIHPIDLHRTVFDKLSLMIYNPKTKTPSIELQKHIELLSSAILYFGGKVKRFVAEADIVIVPDQHFDRVLSAKGGREVSGHMVALVNHKWVVDSILQGVAKNTSNELYKVAKVK